MLIALLLCGPFGWHHRTQMTSWEARGFQLQHLALWQPVRPSVPNLGCLQMFLILQCVSLFLPLQENVHTKTSQTRRAGRFLSEEIFCLPLSGSSLYLCLDSRGISEGITQAMPQKDWSDVPGAGVGSGGVRPNKSHCYLPLHHPLLLFFLS